MNVSACKSVDSVKEVASSFFPNSIDLNTFDFGKLASVVDEQFSALRDFVGVNSAEEQEKTKKRPLKLPKRTGLDPFDVEDVAIEVEYVDDGSAEGGGDHDESFEDPFGKDFKKKAMHCAEETAPAGEPSSERRRGSKHDSARRRQYV